MLSPLIYAIILLFSFILREFLTPVSLILVIISSFRLFSKRLLNQLTINILCLGIFSYYLLTYGKLITPEIGLNFLLSIILLKFMESKKYRDDVMCIFGMMLLISSGSLFEKTLSYFIFFSCSFIILIHCLFKLNNVALFTVRNSRSYVTLSLFTVLLFFIFPRIPNPIPFTLNAGGQGEIGYSPEINISSIEKLSENDAKVFWAKLSMEKTRQELYWRGNVASETDGWNWSPGHFDQGFLTVSKEDFAEGEEYRLFIKSPYLFIYDAPSLVKVNHKVYQGDGSNSFNSSYLRSNSRYFVKPSKMVNELPSQYYLNHHLGEQTVQWIKENFQGESIEEIVEEYRQLIIGEKFEYSWSPGKIKNFTDFMEKKIGFCTHYASSLALILRVKNHPTRLVSGFQGGRFNPYGEFYEISQNDAHAWVEVHDLKGWRRIDPTSFIAPERIILDYQEVVSNNFVIPQSSSQEGITLFNDLKFILSQWDFEFYQMMDQWDAAVQTSFFSPFKLTRARLFFISILTVVAIFLLLLKRRKHLSWRERAWSEYLIILTNRGIYYQGSFNQLARDLEQSDWPKKEEALTLNQQFMELFYADKGQKESIARQLKELSR